MKSMKSLSREEAHEIIDQIYDLNSENGQVNNEVGSLFKYRSFQDDCVHSIIILNSKEDII